MTNRTRIAILGIVVAVVSGCFGGSNESGSVSRRSYSFSAAVSAEISRFIPTALMSRLKGGGEVRAASSQPALCSSVVCFDATTLTGTYYKIGLLIQSSGNGMLASFGDANEPWSDITGGSAPFSFDSASPVTTSGELSCCSGTGDLASENTYFSDVAYLFGYLDATFTISGITGNTSLNGQHTVRFVLAEGAHPGAQRGDVLYRHADTFKWMDSAATGVEGLSTSRPTTPVTMNSSVVNWTNPFGSQGQQNIPTISAPISSCDPAQPEAPHVVTEAELMDAGRVYSFGFNTTKLLMFPTVLQSDINLISDLKQLLTRVHLAGLPHSSQPMGVGSPASTQLSVTVAEGGVPWSCPPTSPDDE